MKNKFFTKQKLKILVRLAEQNEGKKFLAEFLVCPPNIGGFYRANEF